MGDYWLDDVLTQYEIGDLDRAGRVLGSDRTVYEIAERFKNASPPLEPLDPMDGERVVAGTVLDLSGHLDCGNPKCITDRVDTLFGHVWHYFDDVVVTGLSSEKLDVRAEYSVDNLRGAMLTHIEVLLYLEQTGARDLLTFREKPHWCVHTLPQAAEGLGLRGLEEMREEFVAATVPKTEFTRRPRWDGDNGFHEVMITRPWGGAMPLRVEAPQDESESALLRAAVEAEFHEIADTFAGDVLRSRAYKAPLAVHNDMHGNWLQGNTALDESQVALALSLPVLVNVPPKDIVAIRKEEGAAFEAFKLALRTVIRERIAAAVDGDTNQAIAKEVSQDVLMPAVVEIERGLRGAQRVLARKSASRAAFAMVGAAAGLLTGLPEIVTGTLGLGGIGLGAKSMVPLLDEYHDTKRELEAKDMYFLWKAEQRMPRT